MMYMVQPETFLQYVSIRIVYKNEWLGGVYFKMEFAQKVNFLLNKYIEEALENLETLETYKLISETDEIPIISSKD